MTSKQIPWYDIIKHKHVYNRCRQHELTVNVCGCLSRAKPTRPACVVCVWKMACQGTRTQFLFYSDEWAALTLHTASSLYLSCHFASVQHKAVFSHCKNSQGNSRRQFWSSWNLPVYTHGHTCAALTFTVVHSWREPSTTGKDFMLFSWIKWWNQGKKRSKFSQKFIWTAGQWNYTDSPGHADKWEQQLGWQ